MNENQLFQIQKQSIRENILNNIPVSYNDVYSPDNTPIENYVLSKLLFNKKIIKSVY